MEVVTEVVVGLVAFLVIGALIFLFLLPFLDTPEGQVSLVSWMQRRRAMKMLDKALEETDRMMGKQQGDD